MANLTTTERQKLEMGGYATGSAGLGHGNPYRNASWTDEQAEAYARGYHQGWNAGGSQKAAKRNARNRRGTC